MRTKNFYDVVVIGGGPAGLSAAIKAREITDKVLLIERDRELGGILPQCIHNGFGLHTFGEDLTGPEFAQRYINKLLKMQIEVKLRTFVLNIDQHKEMVLTSSKSKIEKIRTKSIILAMGCRERTRGAINISGSRPAGIYTAGTAQRLVNIEGYLPGKRVVILGSGDIGLIMARRFTWEGAKVLAVIEIMPFPGGLTRNVVQCLEDYKIPLYLSHTIVNIQGKNRIEKVIMAKVGENRQVIAGTEKELPCDTLLLSVGLIPENELSTKMGIILDRATGGPVVNHYLQTSIPGVFACGNVTCVHDLVDNVVQQGEIAGENAALYAINQLPPVSKLIRIRAGENVQFVIPQLIGTDKEVKLFFRVKRPLKMVRAEIRGTNLFRFLRGAKPAEFSSWKLNINLLKEIKNKKEIIIDVKETEKKD